MTKRCEPEIGRSLRAAGVDWLHKCPDVRYGAPDKVDYHFVLPDGSGITAAIEVKETTAKETFPWTEANITIGQRDVLRRINTAGGLGLLIVNFWRSHDVGTRRRGVLGVYRWPFVLLGLSDGETLRLDQANWIIEPIKGDAPWPLRDLLTLAITRELNPIGVRMAT